LSIEFRVGGVCRAVEKYHLWVEDFPTAHDRVMLLGARVLKAAGNVDSGENFQVYADPARHPFCLCWVEGRKPR